MELKNIAKTRDLISHYNDGGMDYIRAYLFSPDIEVVEGTWPHKIKNLLSSNFIWSTEEEIKAAIFNINLIK